MTQNIPAVIKKNQDQPQSVFLSMEAFENGQRMAQVLAKSQLIPQNFQNNLPDCIIALELAMRIGASPMAVLQNTYIVHGKPGYSATFIIAMINTCGRYSPLRFEFNGEGDNLTCVAWAKELASGERLDGPPISIDVAKKEGWYQKKGSKWQTMPDLMLRYRAATFFGRMYAPELLMGMRSVEELKEVGPKHDVVEEKNVVDLNDAFTINEKPVKPAPSNDVQKEEQANPEKKVDPEKKIILREPGVVGKLKKDIGLIDSLKTFELWLEGADEIINKQLAHDLDKAEIREFIDQRHHTLSDAGADDQQVDVDDVALQLECNKINKLTSTDAVDKWSFGNHNRISSSYNEATVNAIMQHVADVRNIFDSDEDL